jgi:chromosome segregation ATPase
MDRTDLNQIATQVGWLDEERRRDKDTITRLQSALDAQTEEMRDQVRRIQELEGRLTSAQAQMVSQSALERTLQQFKDEITLLLERQEEKLQEKNREAGRLRIVEQEKMAKQSGELRKELMHLSRLDEEFNLCRAEVQRLGGKALDFQHKFEEWDQMLGTRLRNLTYLEEQRTRDAKRMAQLQEETTDLLKRQEAMTLRVQTQEEAARRNEHRMNGLDASEAERAQQRREFIESLQRAEQARARQMTEWREMVEDWQKRMNEAAEQMRRSYDQYMESKRMLENLEKLEERLNRGFAETAELLRLAEARQKTKLEEWQAEDEKRNRKQLLLWEQQWRDHDRRNEEQLGRISALEKQAQFHGTKLAALWEIEETHAHNWANQAQELTSHLGELEVKLQKEKKRP